MGLFAGEDVQVLESNEHGWWLGVIERDGNLLRGYFPKNYVKEKPRVVNNAPKPPPRPVSLAKGGADVNDLASAMEQTSLETQRKSTRGPSFSLRSLTAFDDLMSKGYSVEIANDPNVSKGLVGAVGQLVTMQCTASIWDGASTETKEFASGILRFAIGKRGVVPGLEAAAQIIAENQKATITCSPKMAYGAAGNPPVVPPNSFVIFHVQVLSISDPDRTDFTVEGPAELMPSGVATSRAGKAVAARRESGVILVSKEDNVNHA